MRVENLRQRIINGYVQNDGARPDRKRPKNEMGLGSISTGAAMQKSGLEGFSDGCGLSRGRGSLRRREGCLLLIPADMEDAMQLTEVGEGEKDKQSQSCGRQSASVSSTMQTTNEGSNSPAPHEYRASVNVI